MVVKVGSAVLASKGELDRAMVASLARQLSAAADAGVEVVLVSSGAVASGFRVLGFDAPPKTIMHKQASAAVGQQRLMAAYAAAFSKRGRSVGQVLLTADDFAIRGRFLNARQTLAALLTAGVVPIINENDSVAADEIKLGDNDNLSTLVAAMLDADLLLILSTVEGLYDFFEPVKNGPPRVGNVVREVRPGERVGSMVGAGTSGVGTGGMATKIAAAEHAARHGIATVIAPGLRPGVVPAVLTGDPIGTHFLPRPRSLAARKSWIGHAARARGVIRVDAGAERAIVSRGASLLPRGIVAVEGRFNAGDAVDIGAADGRIIARGLALYSSQDVAVIKGLRSGEIAGVLGHAYADEVVHRDDLFLKPTT